MDLNKEITENVPDRFYEEKDIKGLTDLVRISNSKKKDDLVKAIEAELAEIEAWLKHNNSTSIDVVKSMSLKVSRLEKLKIWKEVCNDFL